MKSLWPPKEYFDKLSEEVIEELEEKIKFFDDAGMYLRRDIEIKQLENLKSRMLKC